ncbi:fibronectin type III domain-containing protein [Leucobacter sp. UCD-THU]|uniref:fibronectin type III domain-containing protein n=1 Tax=Leucobacter sp. UCD-THU TaxID=1292023 RepID=UPI000374858B|nr:fibronectin type III domain-containing protein [Leucobacter sp. UCD-THU]
MVDYWGPADARNNQLMVSITWSQNAAANTTTVRCVYYLVVSQWVASSAMQLGYTIAGGGATVFNGYAQYAAGTHVVMDYSRTIVHNANGDASVTVTGYVYDAINAYINVPVTVTNLTLPRIPPPVVPPAPPGAPVLSVARNSDTQHTLSWSRPGTAATRAIVQRRENSGAWTQIASLSGDPASYVDRATKANRRYDYRVIRSNTGGSSAWSGTVTVYTTPAVPTGISATRTTGGIRVDATSKPPYAASYDVADGDTVVASGVALPWVHENPNAALPHTYKVRAKRGALVSTWSAASPTVQLTAPPNAPGNLTPNGALVSSEAQGVLGWRHNPADASEQTRAQVQMRRPGGAWSSAEFASSAQSKTWPTAAEMLDEFGMGGDGLGLIEWQVRTKGAHPDWGAWSAVATADVAAPPVVTITSPEDPLDSAYCVVSWLHFQSEGRPQSAWEAILLDEEGAELERRSGDGATSSVTMRYRLEDQHTYRVTVRTAVGPIWSAPVSTDFAAEFVPPAPPRVLAEWREELGCVQLVVGEGDPGEELRETIAVDVLRSIDGGVTWEAILEQADPNLLFDDWESLTAGLTTYRAIAYAETGASATTDYVARADSPALWLSGGIGFATAARLPYNPAIKVDASRARSVQRYEGRALGVPYAGEQLTRTVDASGALLEDDPDNPSIDRMIELAQTIEPVHLYRDPDGRRIYGVIGSISLPRETGASDGAVWRWSFQLEETDRGW